MEAPEPADGSRPSDGGQGAGGGSGSGGTRPQNRNRNRNRNRSGAGRSGSGGGSRGGGSAQAGGGGQSGGGGQARGGAGRSGSNSRKRPSSGGGGRGRGQGPTGRDRGSQGTRSGPPAPAPLPPVDRSAANSEETAVIRANRRRAGRLAVGPGLAAGAVVGVVMGAVSGLVVVGVAVLVVVTAIVAMWWWRRAPGAVLRAVGARPSVEAERPRLHNLVDGLCATMGLPAPDISVVDSDIPNAMAVGHDPRSATLVVTSALDYSLSLVELEGVLAHELVHVKRHDTVVAALAVTTMAPWSAMVGTHRAAARVHDLAGQGREFAADQRAAGVVRYPPGIGSALETMLEGSGVEDPWPPGRGRTAALTRWLWIDPNVAADSGPPPAGDLDDIRVRAAALALR